MHRYISPLLALTAALALCAAPRASAQPERSPNELRVENDMLKDRIAELESQLEQARRRIEMLERTIATLRQRRGSGDDAGSDAADAGSNDSTDGPPRAEVPAEPFASPASMRAHLEREYAKTMGDKPFADQRDRQTYLRELRGWARSAAQQGRGPVQWTVRVLSSEQIRPGTVEFMLEVVDPASALAIGEAFNLSITGRNGVRLQEGGPDDMWILDAIMQTDVNVNPERESGGTEGAPTLIGPFAEFSFNLVVRTVRPHGG
jgi:hypothetical protein